MYEDRHRAERQGAGVTGPERQRCASRLLPSEGVMKSTVDEIRRRFDADVERFSNLETGQSATLDAPWRWRWSLRRPRPPRRTRGTSSTSAAAPATTR